MNARKLSKQRLVHGVGTNDADYAVVERKEIGYVGGKRKRETVWKCACYSTWADMIRRCYSTKFQDKNPTYKGCSVSDDWLTFSNFKSWMEKQDWEGNQLDKDLLFEGNKVYSSETCVFVTHTVNSFTTDCGAARGEWMIGVSWRKQVGKFQSKCRNPFTKKREHLGYFDCEQAAHEAWLKRKLELARELASIQPDPRVAEALISRYENYNNGDLPE